MFQLDPGGDHVNQYNRFLTKTGKQDSMEAQLDYFIDSIFNEKVRLYYQTAQETLEKLEKRLTLGMLTE